MLKSNPKIKAIKPRNQADSELKFKNSIQELNPSVPIKKRVVALMRKRHPNEKATLGEREDLKANKKDKP